MLLLLLILLLFGGGGFGYSRWGYSGGFGLGGVVFVIIILWMLFGDRGIPR